MKSRLSLANSRILYKPVRRVRRELYNFFVLFTSKRKPNASRREQSKDLRAATCKVLQLSNKGSWFKEIILLSHRKKVCRKLLPTHQKRRKGLVREKMERGC